MKPARIHLVSTGHALVWIERDILKVRARRLYPNASADFIERWVDARLHLGKRKPEVEIGIQRIDTSRVIRALPPGSVAPTVEIPQFLRLFNRRA